MFYILEGLIFTILAAGMSGVHGRSAREIGLPFGAIAEGIWVAVPVIFLVVAISPVRKRLARWQHFVHVAAFGCITLPILIFFSQTNQIPLTDFPSTEASREIRERFRDQVMIVGDSGGTRAYFPETLDRNEVAQVIFALDPSIKPTNPKDAAEQPATAGESK